MLTRCDKCGSVHSGTSLLCRDCYISLKATPGPTPMTTDPKDAKIAEATKARMKAEAERDRWKKQSEDWQVRGWELGQECDRLTAERDAALAQVARLHHLIRAASDPDFLWGAMDNVNDMDADITEFANAASRAIRASIPILAAAEKEAGNG